MGNSRLNLGASALLTAVVFAIYAPAARAPLIFDDQVTIGGNPSILKLWPPSIPLSPPENSPMSGRPVVNFTFAVNRALSATPDSVGGRSLDTTGYHIANVIFHLLCGGLLFALIRRVLRCVSGSPALRDASDGVALATVSLWLLHPIHAEAVNYLTQRTEILVSLCYLGVLYAWQRGREAARDPERRRWWAIAAGAALLGAGCKEVIVTVPIAVVLFDRAFWVPGWRRLTSDRETIAWYLVMLAAVSPTVVAALAGARYKTVGFGLGIPWYDYLYSQGWAVAHYLRLTVLPFGFTIDYGFEPIRDLRGLAGGLVVLGLLGATIRAWVHERRFGWAAFLGSAAFLLLAPSSSFIPITTELAAERRVYLASAAVVLLAVVGSRWLALKYLVRSDDGRRRTAVRWYAGATLAVSALLAAGTFARSRLFADPVRLWEDAIARVPENSRAYGNLAVVHLYAEPPRLAQAESLFRRAVEVNPGSAQAWQHLVALLMDQDREAEAAAALLEQTRAGPMEPAAIVLLAQLVEKLHGPAEAIPFLERAASVRPGAASYADLGVAYLHVGRKAEAARAFAGGIGFDPNHSHSLVNLGAILLEAGESAEAADILERAVRADTAPALSLALLAGAYADLGRDTAAAAAAERAVALEPDNPRVLQYAGFAMLDIREARSAERILERAVSVDAGNTRVLTALGHSRAMQGKREQAVQAYRQALSLDPDFTPAREALARVQGGGR